MQNKNSDVQRGYNLLAEYFRANDVIDGNDARIGKRQDEIESFRRTTEELVARQAEIVSELSGQFAEVGLVKWRRNATDFVIRHEPGQSFFTISELHEPGALMRARHAMLADEDADDTGEFAPALDTPKDDYLYALERVGALDQGDDSIELSDGDSIRLPLHDYIARNGGRTPTIANGIAVIDQEAG